MEQYDPAPPQLDEETLYEECPRCQGAANGCLVCFDEGLVEHGHGPINGDWSSYFPV